ncbi:MAG TPA: deaminase [Thermoguttaceae bacterium]|nr:deaminase [Thermoguttaceae bacterium]
MGRDQTENPPIIGLTGSFGSGCSYIARHILSGLGYQSRSLSEQLKKEYCTAKGTDDLAKVPRKAMQDYGDELRSTNGGEYLARKVIETISENGDSGTKTGWVIDSIRNPEEIHFLREKFPNFFLFGVYASRDRRWERIKDDKYHRNRGDFEQDDERDTGRHSDGTGQRVEDCFAEADVVIANDTDFAAVNNSDFESFKGRLGGYIDRISNRLSRQQPTESESLMAAAYTVSQRSSCLKRKVGAVIADDCGNIISSGFNEVPEGERPCIKKFTTCGRTRQREEFETLLKREFGDKPDACEVILAYVRDKIRMLDQCRALHAEENAIVNLARNGRSVPLDRCTLYSTTYPCRLCANKIVNLGLQRVVYLEPYPDPEAKYIFQDKVKDSFFEGITFKAYSRIYGERK